MSKLKDDLKQDPTLASQYGVILKSNANFCIAFNVFLRYLNAYFVAFATLSKFDVFQSQ